MASPRPRSRSSALRLTTAAAALLSLARPVAGFNCSQPPIYVDIHSRVTSPKAEFLYGSFIGLGSPAQNQSLWPSLSQNETSFAARSFCERSAVADCERVEGGNVDGNLSTTWKTDEDYRPRDARRDALYGTDTLHLYTHYFDPSPAWQTSLENFTTSLVNSGSSRPGIVGIGSQSTLLARLYQLGLIAGRTYSLYIGSGMDRAGGTVNGSNVFGGYDSGRFKGPVHTYPMDLKSADYLPVTVADIVLEDAAHGLGKRSIMNGGVPFEARITTDQYPMRLPAGVTRNFADLLEGEASGESDGSLMLQKPFNGSMTIRLSDGFSVTLPADVVRNASNLSPVEQAQNANYTGPYYLSTAWLSEVYLMLDFEGAQFHLAQALPHGKYVMPRTFCPNSVPVPYGYRTGISRFVATGMIGAVIGGVIGGIALVLAVLAVCVVWRREKARKRAETEWMAVGGGEKPRRGFLGIGRRRGGQDVEMRDVGAEKLRKGSSDSDFTTHSRR
ncbi:hypothetical protein EJ06DRAFT_489590 [Trichodelitschia bisporula]|uniref:Peptidase A1 domain-containing protein n=1 Tax=Trichodelitschia bisporula TaxID=703511 RepID=A0A6G1I3R6_9PEZI|nr:hypothetical protein EJ06DRAFT_489590 [Trichodelitschia bisporula]